MRQKSKCAYCKGIKQRVEDERQKQLDCVGVRVAVRSILKSATENVNDHRSHVQLPEVPIDSDEED